MIHPNNPESSYFSSVLDGRSIDEMIADHPASPPLPLDELTPERFEELENSRFHVPDEWLAKINATADPKVAAALVALAEDDLERRYQVGEDGRGFFLMLQETPGEGYFAVLYRD